MLKGKTAVVTGASRGIGAAIAKKLAMEGADVAVLYCGSEDRAQAVCNEICEKNDVKCKIYRCDDADSEACNETTKAIIADFGGIDILVNNAGITRDNLLIAMSDADFDAVVNTNLKGCFHMIRACGRNFVKRKYGKIINISSVSGIEGIAGQANYAAAKAGVIALTKVTAREFAGKYVCCNAIAPGFIRTDMTRALEEDPRIAAIPLKRMGEAEDVANLAAFLASSASDYITGEVIKIDGGLTM